MPKMKTKRAAKKRLKKTATGKLMRAGAYKQHKLDVEDPINIRAVELLGELHDVLKDGGYSGHNLERFLVRVLFCLFAEDTGLLPKNVVTDIFKTGVDLAHKKLDAAVAAAYGFAVDLSNEQILEKLLALNLERAAQEKSAPRKMHRTSRAKSEDEFV